MFRSSDFIKEFFCCSLGPSESKPTALNPFQGYYTRRAWPSRAARFLQLQMSQKWCVRNVRKGPFFSTFFEQLQHVCPVTGICQAADPSLVLLWLSILMWDIWECFEELLYRLSTRLLRGEIEKDLIWSQKASHTATLFSNGPNLRCTSLSSELLYQIPPSAPWL